MGVRRVVALVAAGVLLLSGCESRSSADPAPPSRDDCSDVSADARAEAVCNGVWVRAARHTFVPQGLALGADESAFISGYHAARHGYRYCEVLTVDRGTGRMLARVTDIHATGPAGGTVRCRHGGGLAQGPEGLWISQRSRVWLVDPDEIAAGRADTVRFWNVTGRVRASAVVRRGAWLGLVGYSERRSHFTHWLRVDRLLEPGVWEIAERPAPATVVPAHRSRSPRYAQGATSGPGGIWYASSTSRCGVLHAPRGAEIAFVPGAEGLAFEGRQLWVVSETGARPYQRYGDRPVVPTLMSVRVGTLDRSLPTGCGWG